MLQRAKYRKNHPLPNGGQTRYEILYTIAEIVKPKTFIEVGVHKGLRAKGISEICFDMDPSFSYVGYDLWEDLLNAKEVLHGKGASSIEHVLTNLKSIEGFEDWELIQGDTETTLLEGTVADMVFIDGDHRDYAIQRDFDRVKDSETIVFDDHYTPSIDGYGCNRLEYPDEFVSFLVQSSDTHNNSFFGRPTTINLLVLTKNKELQNAVSIH